MLKLAICEDDSYILNDLQVRVNTYLKKLKIKSNISCFSSGISLLLSNECFDVIIMDIKMDGIDGMETIRRLRNKGINSHVIFVTSTKNYVFQAFDVEAVHYLLKPVSDQELFQALDKAIRRFGQEDHKVITITKGSLIQVIPYRDILYCESIDHKICIRTAEGKIEYYNKLEELQRQLDDRFFRCHRSYIVNMNFVSGKDKDVAIMVNGDKILVSRRKQQEFSHRLLSFIRNEVL